MGFWNELREEFVEYGATVRQWILGPPVHWRALPWEEQRRIAARMYDIDQLNRTLGIIGPLFASMIGKYCMNIFFVRVLKLEIPRVTFKVD